MSLQKLGARPSSWLVSVLTNGVALGRRDPLWIVAGSSLLHVGREVIGFSGTHRLALTMLKALAYEALTRSC